MLTIRNPDMSGFWIPTVHLKNDIIALINTLLLPIKAKQARLIRSSNSYHQTSNLTAINSAYLPVFSITPIVLQIPKIAKNISKSILAESKNIFLRDSYEHS